MGTLQPDEINLIAVRFQKNPVCPARSHSFHIMEGPTPEELLDVQMFLNHYSTPPCWEVWALMRLYDDHLTRHAEYDRQQRDPTIQERDRRKLQKGDEPL